jgi:hypothetical protein
VQDKTFVSLAYFWKACSMDMQIRLKTAEFLIKNFVESLKIIEEHATGIIEVLGCLMCRFFQYFK